MMSLHLIFFYQQISNLLSAPMVEFSESVEFHMGMVTVKDAIVLVVILLVADRTSAVHIAVHCVVRHYISLQKTARSGRILRKYVFLHLWQ